MAVEHLREFEQELARSLEESLRDEYAVEATVEPKMVLKTNGELPALQVKVEGESVSPTIYTSAAFERYQDGMPIESIAHEMCESVSRAMRDTPEFPELTPEEARKHITLTLVNTAMNQELLGRTPHFDILGGELSAIPRWYIDEGASFIVSNDLCKSLMLTPEEVLQIGQENINAQRFEVKSMQQLLSEMMGVEFNDMMPSEDIPEMIVVTSENRIQGSSCMLSRQTLEDVHQKIGDYVILPSSIHEIICVSINEETDPDELRMMVSEINRSEISPEEVLSNNIMKYDGHKLTVVGDSLTVDPPEMKHESVSMSAMRFVM